MIKKFLASMLVVLFVLTMFTGCTDETDSAVEKEDAKEVNGGAKESSSNAEEEDDEIVIAYANGELVNAEADGMDGEKADQDYIMAKCAGRGKGLL